MDRTVLALSGTLALFGCDALEEGVNAGFEEEFAIACKNENAQLGTSDEVSVAMCDCAAKRSAEELSISEKLSDDTSKIDAIMKSCLEETIRKRAASIETTEAS